MTLLDLITTVVAQTAASLAHNWPFLLAGILSAAALKVYVGTERIARLFRRRTGVAVAGSVAAAVATPFCSCGTTAIVLSMLAASVPWAPIVAFMVASPLTSPDELILSVGLFGAPFALFFFCASIVLGVTGGLVAFLAQGAGWLENQARFSAPVSVVEASPFGPGAASVAEFALRADPWRLRSFVRECLSVARRMLPLFIGFAAIGFAAIAIIPEEWITTLLGGSNPLSVVIAATIGIPFYVSTGASLPLVASLMAGGMGTGPAMAFLITGAGTSVGAVAGGLLIARWRVLGLVVGTLWIGAIILGLLAGAIL